MILASHIADAACSSATHHICPGRHELNAILASHIADAACSSATHHICPGRHGRCKQVIYPVSADEGSAKLSAGRLVTISQGYWLLPFWRELSGNKGCWQDPADAFDGVPGIFVSADQVSCP